MSELFEYTLVYKTVNIIVYWNVKPCSLAEYRHFEGSIHLYNRS